MQTPNSFPQGADRNAEDMPAVGAQAFYAHRAADAPANVSPDEREARERGTSLVDDVREEVRQRPGRSLLIFGLLGMVCGTFL